MGHFFNKRILSALTLKPASLSPNPHADKKQGFREIPKTPFFPAPQDGSIAETIYDSDSTFILSFKASRISLPARKYGTYLAGT